MNDAQVNAESVRIALRALSVSGSTVSTEQLYAVFGLDDPRARAGLREVTKAMRRAGELHSVTDGVYRYNPDFAPLARPALDRVWRYVRKAKPGWTIAECVMHTGTGLRQVREYCAWLLEQGYITRVGKQVSAYTYRATAQADATPQTPHPPAQLRDPFEREHNAALKIVRLLLRENPTSARVMAEIADAARTLLARFGSKENENEPA